MLCGCIMLTMQVRLPAVWLHQAADGPQWGSKGMLMVRVNCKDRCNFCLHKLHTSQWLSAWSLITLVVSGAVVVVVVVVFCVILQQEMMFCATKVFFLCVRIFCAAPVWLCCLSSCFGCVWQLIWPMTGHLSHNLNFDSPVAFWELFLKGFMAVTVNFRLLAKVKNICPTFLSFG